MSSDKHDNYRPQSPDLSAFAPPPPPPLLHLNQLPSYAQESGLPAGYPLHRHRGSYDASPYFSPATTQPSTSYFPSQSQASPQTYSPHIYHQSQPPPPLHFSQSDPFNPRHVSAPRLQQAIYHQPQPPPQSQPYASPFPQTYQTSPPIMARPRRRKSSADDDSADDSYNPNPQFAGRTSKKAKWETDAVPAMTKPPSGNLFEGVEVKTKFPVARIKRIMQADEDVGKVAQATPTAVSKALELFMITLVMKGAEEARQKNSKKITAIHLKQALMKDSQFDFLDGICEKVPDPTEKRGGQHGNVKSDDDGDEGFGAGGKKKKGKRKGTSSGGFDESD